MQIKIENDMLFDEKEFELNTGLTLFIGANGSGKTKYVNKIHSLLQQKQNELHVEIFRYDRIIKYYKDGVWNSGASSVTSITSNEVEKLYKPFVNILLKDGYKFLSEVNLEEYFEKLNINVSIHEVELKLNILGDTLEAVKYNLSSEENIALAMEKHRKFSQQKFIFPFDEYHRNFTSIITDIFKKQEFDSIESYYKNSWITDINALLQENNFTYQIEISSIDNPKFNLRFFKDSTTVTFEYLSDGEKIKFIILLFLYIYNKNGNNAPLVILFDEVERNLDINNTEILVNILNDLCSKYSNLSIILATHSPTLIALASNAVIYRIFNDNKFYSTLVSLDEALDETLKGVSRIAIKPVDNIIIFCESELDASFYQKIYEKCMANREISSEKKLIFKCFGKNPATMKEQSNYVQVIELLDTIGRNVVGIKGLIDYDGHNITQDNIIVFGERYTIENYIFDPICFLAYLSEKSTELYAQYFDGSTCDIEKMDINKLQQGINKVLISWDFEINDMIDVQSIGEIKYQLPRTFIENNGHNIAKRVKKNNKNIFAGYMQYDLSKKISFLSEEFVKTLNVLLSE